MWDFERAWKTPAEGKKELKEIEIKKDKIAVWQDNIQMHYLGMGREEVQKKWSKGGVPTAVLVVPRGAFQTVSDLPLVWCFGDTETDNFVCTVQVLVSSQRTQK